LGAPTRTRVRAHLPKVLPLAILSIKTSGERPRELGRSVARIDLRFLEVAAELWSLQELIEILDRNLPTMIAGEKKEVWEGVDMEDEQAMVVATASEQALDSGITTRFLPASALVALWALYETSIIRFAGYLREKRGLALTPSDLRGGSFQRITKYYADVLRVPLHPPGTDWSRLEALEALRHACAHANACLDYVPEADRRKLETIVAKYSGVALESGYIVITTEFLKRAYAFVSELLNELNERVRKEISDVS